MSFLAKLDNALQDACGIAYLKATRDHSIHDRLDYLLHVVQQFSTDGRLRVLDVGCGSGMALRYLSRFAGDRVSWYLGIDLDTHRLQKRYARLDLPHAFHDVDLDDDWHFGEFDLAWCSEVLEHLIDDAGVFHRICRCVRPGGHVVVTTPSLYHREYVGRTYPAYLAVSPIQDGAHVRLGYTESDLARLAAGTSAVLERVDAATRANPSRVRRDHTWPSPLRPVVNILDAVLRTRQDRFALIDDAIPPSRDFVSIIGVYRIA